MQVELLYRLFGLELKANWCSLKLNRPNWNRMSLEIDVSIIGLRCRPVETGHYRPMIELLANGPQSA